MEKEIIKKIERIKENIKKELVDRDEVVDTIIMSILCGENIVLLGPAGTGKSYISRKVAKSFNLGTDRYFEYLLTKFSTPDEIFGNLSLNALKNDKYERNIEGYLPTAELVFLDEIFKANSSILNSLLTIMNEKIYMNGKERINVPLNSIIGASNEFPETTELAPFYDRFLFKINVNPLDKINKAKLLMLDLEENKNEEKINLEEIKILREEAKKIKFSQETISIFLSIIEKYLEKVKKYFEDNEEEDNEENYVKQEEEISNNIEYISDRKIKKMFFAIKMNALLKGKNKIENEDFSILKHMLWNNPFFSNVDIFLEE